MPRPRDPSLDGKTERIDTRVEPATRQALQEAADAAGHSLSREIEERLRNSLVAGAALGDGVSRETGTLLGALSLLVGKVESWTGQPWHVDGFTRDELAETFRRFVCLLGPDVDGAAAPTSFPANILPDIPSQADLKRSLALQMIEQGSTPASICPKGLIGTVLSFSSHPNALQLAQLFPMERTLRQGLRKLIRATVAKEFTQ